MKRRGSRSVLRGSRGNIVPWIIILVLAGVIVWGIINRPHPVKIVESDLVVERLENQTITFYTPETNYEDWHGQDKNADELIPYRTAGTNDFDTYPEGCWVYIPDIGCWKITDIGVSDLTLCVDEDQEEIKSDVYIIER